jgi:hypothetical protein
MIVGGKQKESLRKGVRGQDKTLESESVPGDLGKEGRSESQN